MRRSASRRKARTSAGRGASSKGNLTSVRDMRVALPLVPKLRLGTKGGGSFIVQRFHHYLGYERVAGIVKMHTVGCQDALRLVVPIVYLEMRDEFLAQIAELHLGLLRNRSADGRILLELGVVRVAAVFSF